jgi:hypothetical protein
MQREKRSACKADPTECHHGSRWSVVPQSCHNGAGLGPTMWTRTIWVDALTRVFANPPCLERRQNRIAKVRVAGSNPVVRSKNSLVRACFWSR